MLERTYPLSSLVAFLLVGACSVDQSSDSNSSSGTGGSFGLGGSSADAGADAPVCAFGQIICEGNTAKTCDGHGNYTTPGTSCATCKDGLGCVQCVPNSGVCSFNLAKVCDATGSWGGTFVCEGPGMSCQPDGCKGPCSPTSLGMSYQGCDFWPTVTANDVWSDRTNGNGFHFGVLLGNVSADKATVKITGPLVDQSIVIAPGEVSAVPLPWVPELKGADWSMPYLPSSPTQNVNKVGSAYRLRSNVPIIAYQFNPLEGKIAGATGCPVLPGESNECYSYSNDASLLIPAHALSSSYVVTGYHAWHRDPFPVNGSGKLNMGDFIAVTAMQTNTEVTVALRPNQSVLASSTFPRFTTGGTTTFWMGQGQVLELFTPGASDSDTFSGTEISTKNNKAIQVLSGVACASIPEDVSPCGHIEDPVLPLETLGKDYVVPVLLGSNGMPAAHTIRVQSISDNTALTFEPASFNGVTLNRGEVLEIPKVTVDVRIASTTPCAVTQYLNGRGDFTKAGFDPQNVGGPSQMSVVPSAQFRTDYSFVASPYYDLNFVAVIAPTGASVSLDQQPIAPDQFFTAVGASGMSVARSLPLLQNNRVHVIHADKPVGILVYGYNSYSSYTYAGGLDLKRGSTAAVIR
jgi:hypothetical protein